MALELLSLLHTFESSTKCDKYRSIQILFRMAKRSMYATWTNFLCCFSLFSTMEKFPELS